MDSKNLSPVLQKIATGPHLSKNLTVDEAYGAMQAIQAGDAHDVQSAIFFIALRMKRETSDEMLGVFRALLDAAPHHAVNVDALVTLADQYAGYARGLPASPFIPAVLSALKVASIIHSPDTMSPKFGLTPLTVLTACGVTAQPSLEAAAEVLEKNNGWVVVDQAVVTPHLAALNRLRDLIVKRPCLSTLECCIRPFHASGINHLVTGFVHKPYPPIYGMSADVAGFDSATFVRGVEGGVVPSLAQVSRYFPWSRREHAEADRIVAFDDITLQAVPIEPAALAIEQTERATAWPELPVSDHAGAAAVCAELGMRALQGEVGTMRDAIRLGAAVSYAGVHSLALNSALESVDAALESGSAWRCFEENRKLP